MHQNVYTSDVSKSPKYFGTSCVPQQAVQSAANVTPSEWSVALEVGKNTLTHSHTDTRIKLSVETLECPRHKY